MRRTIHNREEFLSNIAKQLGRVQPEQTKPTIEWKYRPQEKVSQRLYEEDLLQILQRQCKQIHTDYYEIKQAQVKDLIMQVVNDFGGGPVISWKDERLEEIGLSKLFQERKIEFYEWDPTKQENIEKAERANISITISDITLAESGTVVILTDQNKGRLVSFLPKQNIVIVPKSTIVPRMTQAARHIRQEFLEKKTLSSCIQFITGPSNSADIEMNLVVGVHGPVKVAYIIVLDQ